MRVECNHVATNTYRCLWTFLDQAKAQIFFLEVNIDALLSFSRAEVTLPSLGSGIISLLVFKRLVTHDAREFCTYVKLAVAEKTPSE